ncbi:protein YqhG of unknown function [Paenibacillus sophorae]|uniref:YqhG family protein n=1 Tax=Paenibacillus sophorae TaxID=1333845 RepID=A0A1H8VA44_9BACL|nr:YqhG family protein [Paenibacillus sophorae]QWU13220.1 YqhG family protein [Paenibacillus sophorae]SEP12276.1 protein YqhG of unknown function [Paenibacillus sophorae]
MTMTAQQVQQHVMDYLEATECQIIEKSPVHVTVKLSPRADQMLTDRPYYWGFVERTGAEPQTLSFTFVFDPEKYDAATAPAPRGPSGLIAAGGNSAAGGSGAPVSPPSWSGGSPVGQGPNSARSPGAGPPGGNPGPGAGSNPGANAGGAASAPIGSAGNAAANNGPNDGILARYFGVTPVLPRLGPGLIRREDITFGSRRLRQIWSAAQTEGKCLHLFEAPGNLQRMTLFSAAYEPWLAACFKVELSCDLKREELHFIGVSLLTGKVMENFGSILDPLELTPRLPENVHIQPYEISLSSGAGLLERHILSRLSGQDYSWAEAARRRLQGELEIIDAYYEELLKEPDEEKRLATQEQHASRRKETIWQYEPGISVSPVVYGLFHLRKQ